MISKMLLNRAYLILIWSWWNRSQNGSTGSDKNSCLQEAKEPHITKICPCNIQRFYSAVKIENFIGKILKFFNIFAQNIDCGYTLEYPQSMFWIKKKKNRYILSPRNKRTTKIMKKNSLDLDQHLAKNVKLIKINHAMGFNL